MEQLEGFRRWSSGAAPLVCKLLKAVYGLKQAPFEWNSLLHAFLTDYGLHQLKCDSACYALLLPPPLWSTWLFMWMMFSSSAAILSGHADSRLHLQPHLTSRTLAALCESSA